MMDHWLEPTYDKYLWKGYGEEFTNDLIKVISVNDNKGNPLPLNNTEELFSLFTPMYNVLEVPSRYPRQKLNIIYQAAPTKIIYDPNKDTEVDVPDTLVAALVANTNYLIFASIGSPASMQQAQLFKAEYDQLIEEMIESDTINPQYSTNTEKFYKRGWC